MQIDKNWTFHSKEIASNFDDHVREQLPWYDLATDAVEHIVRQYLPENGLIYDIGASTGNINRILETLIDERSAKYIGLDNSQEMIDKFTGKGEVILSDALEFNYERFDVCVCFLTIMFLPVAEHEDFLNLLTNKIRRGGCLIIVDKCEPQFGYISTVLSRLALKEKLKTTSAEDILKKELSLSGVQRPIKSQMLSVRGVEFFRFGDFAGWIIEGR